MPPHNPQQDAVNGARLVDSLRLDVLNRLQILDTADEVAYEDAVLLAAHICKTPIALISLVTDNRQWFKAKVGMEASETSREVSFCAHTILGADPLVIEDATQDTRFAKNDLVTGDFHLRFYAGAPIYADSVAVGSVCALGLEPMKISDEQIAALQAVARQVSAILDHRLYSKELAQQKALAEKALAESEALSLQLEQVSTRYQNLFENLPSASMTLDLDGKVIDWNTRSTELYGYTFEEAQGQCVIDLVVEPALRQTVREITAEIFRMGGYHQGSEWQVYTKDGTPIWVLSRSIPLLGPAGDITGVVSINMDITARKKAERELEASNKELEQFAYVASHDLSEPLRMICSYLELLDVEYGNRLDDEGRQYLDFALDGGRRMRSMIRDLMELSKVRNQNPEMSAVDLQSVCEEVELNLQHAIEKPGDVTLVYSMLPTVRGNRSQLVRLVQNLVSNSLKFRNESDCRIEITAQEMEGIVEICVADNGIGIDPRFSQKVFDIFQRLHHREQYPGSGIGLAVCRKIVEKHGGSIWVDSAEQKGCRVYMSLQPSRAA